MTARKPVVYAIGSTRMPSSRSEPRQIFQRVYPLFRPSRRSLFMCSGSRMADASWSGISTMPWLTAVFVESGSISPTPDPLPELTMQAAAFESGAPEAKTKRHPTEWAPVARFRIPLRMWRAFGRVAERLGTNKASLLLSYALAEIRQYGTESDLTQAERELAERRARTGGRPRVPS
jgi:hypothetical protein